MHVRLGRHAHEVSRDLHEGFVMTMIGPQQQRDADHTLVTGSLYSLLARTRATGAFYFGSEDRAPRSCSLRQQWDVATIFAAQRR